MSFGVGDCDDDNATINLSMISEANIGITTMDNTNAGNLIVKYKNVYIPNQCMHRYIFC